MEFRFSTIMVAFLVCLTLSACGLTKQEGPELASASASHPAAPPAEASDPTSPTDSSLSPDVTASATINWDGDTPVLTQDAAGQPITEDVEVRVADTDAVRILVSKAPKVVVETVAGDPNAYIMKDGEIALIIGRPEPLTSSDQTWLWDKDETETAFTFAATDLASTQAPASLNLSVTLSTSAVKAAEWVQEPEGPRLFISPSAWARTGSAGVQELGWETVVRDVPEVRDFPGDSLKHQFQCHAIGALDKDTWNLESWYQDIGLFGFMAERCNPMD